TNAITVAGDELVSAGLADLKIGKKEHIASCTGNIRAVELPLVRHGLSSREFGNECCVRPLNQRPVKWLYGGCRQAGAEESEIAVTSSSNLNHIGHIRRDDADPAVIISPHHDAAVVSQRKIVKVTRSNTNHVAQSSRRLRSGGRTPLDQSPVGPKCQAVCVA